MKRFRWLLAVLGLSLGVNEVSAQIFLPNPYGIGVSGGGITYVRSRRSSFLSISAGSWTIGGSGYGYGYYSPGIRVTTVIYAPVYTPPPFFLGPGIPLGPVDPLGPDPAMPDVGPLARMRPLPLDRDQLPPRAAPPERRLPPAERRAPAPELPPPKKQEPKPEPKPQPPPPPKPMPPPPQPPGPEKDPQDENARLVAQGRQAFADQEYGKAAQRFRQATRVAPNLPQAHFLLSQALFALGKYPEAVDAILAGLALQPDWPSSRFRPLELYGPHVADYPDHLRRLEETVEQNPRDPVLLFLYAHQLWFDGRRDEARLLFQRAAQAGGDANVIQRFLRALPAAPVV